MLRRFAKRLLGAFAVATVVFGVIFSVLWLTGNVHDQFSYFHSWLFGALVGVIVGVGYATLDWFYGFVPKSNGGRAPDSGTEDIESR